MTRARLTPTAALQALDTTGGEFTTLLRHGSLEVEIYRPAGIEHRFIDFSNDFATWVFFYGPEGGEAA